MGGGEVPCEEKAWSDGQPSHGKPVKVMEFVNAIHQPGLEVMERCTITDSFGKAIKFDKGDYELAEFVCYSTPVFFKLFLSHGIFSYIEKKSHGTSPTKNIIELHFSV